MDSYRDPAATWLGSPNFTPGRAGHDMSQPSWVVLHTMVGTVQAANSRFQLPAQEASATYGVGLDGRVYQWVDERDAAWANGNTGTGGVGDNLDAISIEHEDGGDFNGPRTPALYAASAALVRAICRRYGIPIDRRHVIGHRECTLNAPTSCPDTLDMDRIVREAAAPPQPAPTPAPPRRHSMVERFARGDGTTDTFELTDGGTAFHTHVRDADEAVLSREALLGTWQTIELVGLWPPPPNATELWFRGTGTDGRLWQANLPLTDGAAWAAPVMIA